MGYEVEDDGPGAACAACGSATAPRQRKMILPPGGSEGTTLMLCCDRGACNRRSGVMAAAITGRAGNA